MNSSSVGCNSGKLPKISIPGKKIKCGYGKKNFPHVWKCILSINSLKVTLCAIWIIHFVQTINHIKHIDLWNTQAPLISFYQHSPDHEISPHYSANIKNFPGGFAPRPPYLFFLFTFNRSWDYYSLQHKYQTFSWGLYPQTPLSIFPVYIQ